MKNLEIARGVHVLTDTTGPPIEEREPYDLDETHALDQLVATARRARVGPRWHSRCTPILMTPFDELLHHKGMAVKPKKILVALDGSSLAAAALETAIDLAAGSPFTLVLLRSAETHALPGPDPTDIEMQVVREAEEYLASVRDGLANRGFANVDTSVRYGSAATAIIDGARPNKADVIVMSRQRRSGLGRLTLGSVAESVLRGTRVPVYIVRSPGAPLEAPPRVAKPGSGKAAVNV